MLFRSLITCMLTAPDIILGLGGLADGTCPEAMVFDNGIMDYALGFTQGFEVNDGALAVASLTKLALAETSSVKNTHWTISEKDGYQDLA